MTGTSKTFTGVTPGTYYVRATPSDNVNADPTCPLQAVTVTSAGDTTAPVIQSIVINAGAPSSYILTYNEVLNSSSLALSKFEVKINGATGPSNVSASASGNTVTLITDTVPDPADVLTLSYTPGTSGARIADTSANFAAGFADMAVTNNL